MQICTLSEQPPASCRFDNNNNNGEEEEERIRIDFQYNINPKDTSWKINNPTKKITQAFSSAGSVKLENILVSSYVTLEPGLYEFGMEGFGKSYILFLGKLYSSFFKKNLTLRLIGVYVSLSLLTILFLLLLSNRRFL